MNSLELYHGSILAGIETLEPRVAHNGAFPDRVEKPAVYASSDIDYAIFMAVVGKRYWGGWDKRKFGDKGFYVFEKFLEALDPSGGEEPTGSVYFLNSENFKLKSGIEWTSESPVRVLGSVAVGLQDLPHFAVCTDRRSSHK